LYSDPDIQRPHTFFLLFHGFYPFPSTCYQCFSASSFNWGNCDVYPELVYSNPHDWEFRMRAEYFPARISHLVQVGHIWFEMGLHLYTFDNGSILPTKITLMWPHFYRLKESVVFFIWASSVLSTLEYALSWQDLKKYCWAKEAQFIKHLIYYNCLFLKWIVLSRWQPNGSTVYILVYAVCFRYFQHV